MPKTLFLLVLFLLAPTSLAFDCSKVSLANQATCNSILSSQLNQTEKNALLSNLDCNEKFYPDHSYVYQNGQLVGQLNSDGSKEFVHGDNLGSNTVMTDNSGSVVENTFYSPFGEVLSGGSSRYDYTGKEFDSVTNDYDFNARRYNPSFARFTEPDMSIPDLYNPDKAVIYIINCFC